MSDRETPLPAEVESALSGWPAPARDDEFWEAQSTSIAERVKDSAKDSTDAALLAAPALDPEPGEPLLQPEPGEPELASAPRKQQDSVPRGGLAELARARVAAEAASTSKPDLLAALTTVAVPTAVAANTSTETPIAKSASEVVGARAQPAPPATPGSSRGVVIAIMSGLAVAAVLFLVLRSEHAAAPAEVAKVPAPVVSHAPLSPAPTAVALPAASAEAVAVGSLPKTDEVASGGAAARAAGGIGGARAVAATPGPSSTAVAMAEPPSKPEAKASDEPPPDPKMKPAESHGALPQQPAAGAVQAALASVLSSAQACVAGQEASSRATVVFGSDGRVQSVSVDSGPAAGAPAAACIRGALSRARVEPFAKATFSVRVTIRPQ